MFVPLLLVTTPPKPVEAQWYVIDAATLSLAFKEAWKQFKMGIARKIINAITQRTVNWINTGFHGNPFYLDNPTAFFKDVVKSELKDIVNLYGYDQLRFPFGKQYVIDTINAYQRQTADNAAYSLSNAIRDPIYLKSYRENFNVGGWDGFLINTQYPQNNYIGFTITVNEDAANKLKDTVQTKAQKVQDTLQKGQGFLAPQTCESNPKYNNGKNEFVRPGFDEYKFANEYKGPVATGDSTPAEIEAASKAYDAARAVAYKEWAKTNECPGGLTTTTPGSVMASQITTAMTSKVKQAELAAALGNAFGAIFDALLNKLTDTAKGGLLKLTSNTQEDISKAEVAPEPGNLNSRGSQTCIDNCVAGALGEPDQCTQVCQPTGGSGYTGYTPPGGTSGGGGNTGGNQKCIDAEGVPKYDPYVEAVQTAEGVAYPTGLPAGTRGVTAQAAVCGAYKGPGSCKPASQEDELIISGLSAPYVTLSIDFLIGGYPYSSGALYSRAVAACEAGVQDGTATVPLTPQNDPNNIGIPIKIPLTEKIISPEYCWIWCIEAGGGKQGGSAGNCVFECTIDGTINENMNRDACVQRCTKGGGSRNTCSSACSAPYYDLGVGGADPKGGPKCDDAIPGYRCNTPF